MAQSAPPANDGVRALGGLTAWAGALSVLTAWQWHFHVVPGHARLQDRLVGAAALFGTNVVLAAPGVLAARLARGRAASIASAAWLFVVASFVLADALVHASFGRHLVGLLGYLRQDHPWDVAGGSGALVRAALACAFSSLVCVVVALGVRALLTRQTSAGLRGALVSVVIVTAGAATLSAPLWASESDLETTFEAFPVDLRILKHPDAEWGQIGVLEAQLTTRLGSALPRLRQEAARPCLIAGKPEGRLPSVVVVFVESFRDDSVTEELMPRLTRYARSGLRLDGHLSGSILSEAGLFALLHAKHPLLYDFTLDEKTRPCTLAAFSALGYRTAYFSGQPEHWRRAEEFVNAATFDQYAHDDRGSWNDWDVSALSGLVGLTKTSGGPVFGVAYLMSSHFEYRFPKAYALFQPSDSSANWPETNMRALSEMDAPLFRNRYRNTLRFLDDAIMNAVSELDPEHTLVVVTGDHGESIADDGHFGHGYAFADVIARTPAIIVGPGIAPGRRDDPTLHVDLLPTLVRAATSGRVTLSGARGRDLGDPALRSRPVLLAASDVGRYFAITELRGGPRPVDLQIHLNEGRVVWEGVRDGLGKRVAGVRVTPEFRRDTLAAFDAALAEIAPNAP